MASACFISDKGLDEFSPLFKRAHSPIVHIGNYRVHRVSSKKVPVCESSGRRRSCSQGKALEVTSSNRDCEILNHSDKDPVCSNFGRRMTDRCPAVDGLQGTSSRGRMMTDRCPDIDGLPGTNSRGRPSMEHPTKVYGEVTKHWTPVFALLEHKYTDPKPVQDRDESENSNSGSDDENTELGKPKRRGVLLPAGLTYGRPNGMRDGGSSEALHGWPTLTSTNLPFKRKEKNAQRDFMALNRAAVSAGLVTANDQYEFRATHDVRRKTQSEDSQRSRTRRLPPSMVYGISTRPSTPIFDLLEHKYQDKWLSERRKLELAKRQEENKMGRSTHSAGLLNTIQRRSPGQVYETRASLLRTYQNPVEADRLWQMPKFTKEARPSLQTFRSAQARKDAFNHFESDQISRKGNFGHGTYEAAKN